MFSLYIIFILSTIASALPTRQARILSPRALRPVTSSNWCGLVRNASPIKSVEAEWKVPYSTLPDDGSSEDMYQTYQWVGIDGTNKCGALLQGGTGQTVREIGWQLFGSVFISCIDYYVIKENLHNRILHIVPGPN